MVKDIQFVVSADGEKTGVFLSLQAFEAFEEYLEDLAIGQSARERKNEELIPWEQVKAELIAEGKLDA